MDNRVAPQLVNANEIYKAGDTIFVSLPPSAIDLESDKQLLLTI